MRWIGKIIPSEQYYQFKCRSSYETPPSSTINMIYAINIRIHTKQRHVLQIIKSA